MSNGLEDQLNITAADKEALEGLVTKFSEYCGSGIVSLFIKVLKCGDSVDVEDTAKDFILTPLMRMLDNLNEQKTMIAISKVVDLMQVENAIREIDAQRKNGFASLERKRSFHI